MQGSALGLGPPIHDPQAPLLLESAWHPRHHLLVCLLVPFVLFSLVEPLLHLSSSLYPAITRCRLRPAQFDSQIRSNCAPSPDSRKLNAFGSCQRSCSLSQLVFNALFDSRPSPNTPKWAGMTSSSTIRSFMSGWSWRSTLCTTLATSLTRMLKSANSQSRKHGGEWADQTANCWERAASVEFIWRSVYMMFGASKSEATAL